MEKQHIILYQKNVSYPQYIPTLLSKDKELVLHIVKDIESILERMNFTQIFCILYECDIFTSKNISDIRKIQDLHIPYLIIASQFNEKKIINMDQVIIKSEQRSLSTVFSSQLIVRIKSLYPQMKTFQKKDGFISTHIIGIGASTGGPHAIAEILKGLSKDIGGIIIVQHMTDANTSSFADYLNNTCDFYVKVAQENDIVRDGVVYIAKQKQHLKIKRKHDGYHLHYQSGEKVNCVCPSIDVLFESMAHQLGALGVGILLTGMGSDGASGLKKMKNAGALTIIQDEETSDLYGMPKVAKSINAYQKEMALSKISEYLMHYFKIKEKGKM